MRVMEARVLYWQGAGGLGSGLVGWDLLVLVLMGRRLELHLWSVVNRQ